MRLKDLSVAGNLYDLLKNMSAISQEAQWISSTFHAPYILIPQMNIAGKAKLSSKYLPGTSKVSGIYFYTPDFCFLNSSGPTRSMIQPKASSAHGTTRSQPGT